jgi:hypothetical protein
LRYPLIIDTVANQVITDQSMDQLFAAVGITDPDAGSGGEKATITLLNSAGFSTDANGTLSGPGLKHTNTGTYTLQSATPAGLTSELNAVVFTPTQANQSVTTEVRLAVQNGTTGADIDFLPPGNITATSVSTPTNLNFIYGSIGNDMLALPSGASGVGENLTPQGNDVVNGFNVAQDLMQLSAAQFPSFAAVQASLTTDTSGNAVLHFDSTDSVTLVGISQNNLTTSNFRFV